MNNLKNNIVNDQRNDHNISLTSDSSRQPSSISKSNNHYSTSSTYTTQSVHNDTNKNYTPSSSSAEWRIPALLTFVFLFFVETSRLHPSLSFAGKAWILVMSTYTFKNRRLSLLLKYLLAGILLYTLTKFAVAALACRCDLGYLNLYLNMGKQISYHTMTSSSSGEAGQSRGLNGTSTPPLSSTMQV